MANGSRAQQQHRQNTRVTFCFRHSSQNLVRDKHTHMNHLYLQTLLGVARGDHTSQLSTAQASLLYAPLAMAAYTQHRGTPLYGGTTPQYQLFFPPTPSTSPADGSRNRTTSTAAPLPTRGTSTGSMTLPCWTQCLQPPPQTVPSCSGTQRHKVCVFMRSSAVPTPPP